MAKTIRTFRTGTPKSFDLCAEHESLAASMNSHNPVTPSEEHEGVCVVCSRDLMARVFARAAKERGIDGLLAERKRMYSDGRNVEGEQIDRTIEDMAGHWHEGKFFGAKSIAEANEALGGR